MLTDKRGSLKSSSMTMKMNPRAKRVFKVVFLTQFIDLLAFTLILPSLPKLLNYYAFNDNSGAYDLLESYLKPLSNFFSSSSSVSLYGGSVNQNGNSSISSSSFNKNNNQVLLAGLLGSWFSSLQFISSPLIGSLSDKMGRKPMLLAALFGSLLSYCLWFISIKSFWLFILSRTIGGLSKANVGLSLAIISDVSDENTRGKGMAMIGFSFSLAFITGPMLGAYLSRSATPELDAQALANQLIVFPSTIAILLSFSNFLIVSSLLQETNSSSCLANPSKLKTSEVIDRKRNSIFNFHYINPKSLFAFKIVDQDLKANDNEESHRLKSNQAILKKIGLIYFYYLLFYSGLEFTLSFLTHIRFGFSPMDQGKLYLFSGVLMAIIQGGFVRRLRGGKESQVAMIGLTVIIPAFILMGLSSNVRQIFYSLALYSLSAAVTVPCLTTVVSSLSPPNSKGAVMGILRSLGALARSIGPCVASILFWAFGPTVCYILGAIALVLPVVLMARIYPKLMNRSSIKEGSSLNGSESLEQSRKLLAASS